MLPRTSGTFVSVTFHRQPTISDWRKIMGLKEQLRLGPEKFELVCTQHSFGFKSKQGQGDGTASRGGAESARASLDRDIQATHAAGQQTSTSPGRVSLERNPEP